MKIKLFLCLALLMPIQTKSTGLEIAAGTVIAGAILRTQAAKTMGAVMVGYFLNTVAGRQLTATFKGYMLQKMFGNYATNNFKLPTSSCSDMISKFNGSKSVVNFSGVSSHLQAVKERMKAMNPFACNDSDLNFFHNSQNYVGSCYQDSSSIGSAFNKFRDSYYKTTESGATGFASDSKITNVMAQKVSGFCPKIENNYYSGNYWKGFAHGSFGAWVAAWFLTSDAKNKEEEKLKPKLELPIHQGLASSTEFGSKIS